jgi:dTDP-4-dehydrorhamnose reductase
MKILLFGSSGMLGSYVYNILKCDYTIICIRRDGFDIEIDEWSKLKAIIEYNLNENDIIINCAGIIPQKISLDNYRTYIRTNTLFPHKLNEICKQKNAKLIHVTTDCVYDGLKGNYVESDKHTATNIYGISKSEGEPEDATVIRTSIIGEELSSKKSLLEWVRSNKNGKIQGFVNHYWNGVTCLTLANIIKEIISKNLFWNGVKHVFSSDIVSKYDLCCYINKIYSLNIDIEPHNDSVSKNMTLTGDKIFTIDNIYNQILKLKDFNLHDE